MDQGAFSRFIDLFPEFVDTRLHNIGLGIEIVLPDMLHNHGFGDDPGRVAHQIFQQLELLGLKFDDPFPAADLTPNQIHCQIGNFKSRRGGRTR